ncbi:MAG: phosphatidylglycerol lysyltransferase domain-containing protein [Candidatus Saccharicenans sp.]|nr:phosphatidylglycerol lysyltransferase domain-containing protein [Candidatus Saccharicenans sp.]
MIPEFPELKPVELADREEINRYLEIYPPDICELTFANIFIWRHWEKQQITKINDNLCVLCSPPDEPPYFLEPVGENRLRDTVETCLSVAPRLSRVSERFVSRLGPGFSIREDRDNFDYVYLTEELASLRGKKFDGKRNLIKKFEKSYRAEVRPLAETHVWGCLELLRRWEASSPEENREADEKTLAASTAIREALVNLSSLELQGIVMFIEGRVEGFCLGERLNPETAVVHVELASRQMTGLHQFLNRECARTVWKEFKYINREQDAGLPGLRKSKLSYHPHRFVKKYDLFRG